jgi:hypothetical protein
VEGGEVEEALSVEAATAEEAEAAATGDAAAEATAAAAAAAFKFACICANRFSLAASACCLIHSLLALYDAWARVFAA